jgi:hypothetical protein
MVQPKDIRVMGHCGKHMISPKEDMVDLKCSSLSDSQDMACHCQAHLKCLQHRLETIQSFGRPLPVPQLQDHFPAHLVNPPLASQRPDLSPLRNRAGEMLPRLPKCPRSQRICNTNMMQNMRALIHRTWVGLKSQRQSA